MAGLAFIKSLEWNRFYFDRVLTIPVCMATRRTMTIPAWRKYYFWNLNVGRSEHVLRATISVVVETFSETSHLCWNNETIRFKSSLTSIIIESTYLTLNMKKIWGCFKVQVGWKNAFYGETGSRKVSKRSRRDPDHEKTFLPFTLSVNKIILYQFSMFKSLDSVASVVGMFMYLTISKLKQVLRSRKGLGKVSTTTLATI